MSMLLTNFVSNAEIKYISKYWYAKLHKYLIWSEFLSKGMNKYYNNNLLKTNNQLFSIETKGRRLLIYHHKLFLQTICICHDQIMFHHEHALVVAALGTKVSQEQTFWTKPILQLKIKFSYVILLFFNGA